MCRSLSSWVLFFVLPIAVGCQFSGGAARGTLDVDLKDRNVQDQSDATYLRFRSEYVPEEADEFVGGGIDFDMLLVDDDILGEVEPIGGELFVYIGIHPDLGRFVRLPIRIGPTAQYFELDDPAGDLSWSTLAFKGSIAPELVLIRSRRITEELSLFADLNGFVGHTVAEFEPDTIDDDADAHAYGWGFEAGVRYRFEHVELQGSWFFRAFVAEEADRDFLPDITGIRNEFDGFAVSLTIHFGGPSTPSSENSGGE